MYGVQLLFIFLLLFHPLVGNGQIVSNPLNEPKAGELLLRYAQTSEYVAALKSSSRVNITVSGLVATVDVEQRFHNEGDVWVEGVYVFPLPDGAAVSHMEMAIGERRIVGEIKEKEVAKKIYEQAKKAGKKASLMEQQRPNMFTSRVANIGPGETIDVHIRYVEPVHYSQGGFGLRFPMTITPRYIPGRVELSATEQHLALSGGTGWAMPTDQVPDANEITPPHLPAGGPTVQISAVIDMGMPLADVTSLYHEMNVRRSGNRYELSLLDESELMDRDLELRWEVPDSRKPAAAYFSESLESGSYGLMMVLPPEAKVVEPLSREIIFVIDSSGSMGGTSIVQAKESLKFALQQLGEEDSFNIIDFDSSARSLFPYALPASQRNLSAALYFVRNLQAGGGTEMMPALNLALSNFSDVEADVRVRQVVFITDGAVGNELELFRFIEQRLGSARLFTVGIGSAPNSWFMRKAAEVGAGQFRFIGELDQVEEQMKELFSAISRPLVADIQIDWPTGAESYPARIPDLYPGEPVVVNVRMPESVKPQKINISGRIGDQPWRRSLEVSASEPVEISHAGVGSLWARKKIESLMDELILGKDENQVRDSVLPVALGHRLVSAYTSFVAVEQKVSRPGSTRLEREAVPNARPAGQSPQPYAYPRTSAGWFVQLCWGLLLCLLAASMRLRWL